MSTKRGEAYVVSPEKRRLDVFVATSLVPIDMAFRVLALAQRPGTPLIFHQERMGSDGQVIQVRKMRTLDENGSPISPLMDAFRTNGIDELPQIGNILAGDMSLVGRRPLLVQEFLDQYEKVGSDTEGAKLVDYHRRTAGRAKPGLLSTHAIQGHRGDETVLTLSSRLELDIYDFEQASFDHTVKLFKRALRSIAQSEMHNGSIVLTETGIRAPRPSED